MPSGSLTGGEAVPKLLFAWAPKGAIEERKIRKLAGARHAAGRLDPQGSDHRVELGALSEPRRLPARLLDMRIFPAVVLLVLADGLRFRPSTGHCRGVHRPCP